ncbi:putative Fe(2+)-trafficking protein [Candidatus Annandia adelgestsuga]|uniref:Putative Fe(2+)-trafficking protein n=1 Tax=Candidatus Annandia adelgestsuga TaxID=1302411 RepID=A0A3Q9CLP2_9ENTR|nr:oxidative damage protection protein [Candidatus Annandia adelgestsuga]AZP36264.1 putative Fe(2+)-trafficking protein [Candidatus Annandia adelgestsuga]
MKKKIFCLFLKKISNMQKFQKYPGIIGNIIYKNISNKAWLIWLKKQTMIINEFKLNMNNENNIKKIEKCMISFFFKSKK